MIEIELKDGQNGYSVVTDYILDYLNSHNAILDDVIVWIETSHDGKIWDSSTEYASVTLPERGVEFLYDWYECEKYIRIYGIKALYEIPRVDNIKG